jgi:hypothetical protein
VLRTEFASVVEPIVGYIGAVCDMHNDQVVVLIPTLIPPRLRYRILHNHLDVVLSAALRSREDVIVARVTMPLEPDSLAPLDPGPRKAVIQKKPDTPLR